MKVDVGMTKNSVATKKNKETRKEIVKRKCMIPTSSQEIIVASYYTLTIQLIYVSSYHKMFHMKQYMVQL